MMEHSQSAESLGSSARGAAAGSSFKLRETKEDQSLASRWLEAYATFAFTWPWSLSMGIVAFTLLITAIVGATGVGLTDESDYVRPTSLTASLSSGHARAWAITHPPTHTMHRPLLGPPSRRRIQS